MIIELTDQQREVQHLARDFARNEIAPNSARWNEERHVPVETLLKMADLGFLGLVVPEEFGGAGLDHMTVCLVMEEFAAADAGLSVGFAVQNGLCAEPLVKYGTDEQRREWLPEFASGRRFGAYALTEPDAGSDVAGLKTQGRREDDGSYTITGNKMWISAGGYASVFILFARTEGPGARGISAFVAPQAPGLVVGREIPKMGLHSSSTVELAFDGFRVPADAMLGHPGQGMQIALATLDSGRITIAAQAVGIARAALEVAAGYAKERTAFGGPIARFQGVQFPLADVAAKIDAARALTLQAAATQDAGAAHAVAGAKAKLFASQVAVEAANVAVQTLGGMGYSAEFPAERLYRDARITEIYEGTSQIQRLVIARDLLGDAARG
jgi:alkylation response protein AidB-like acyl-CoA dehydrogenase